MSEFGYSLFQPYIDLKYRDFCIPIVNTKKIVLGVRSGDMKKITKDIAKKYDSSILDSLDFTYFEETNLYFNLLPFYFKGAEVINKAINKIGEIDSWGTTDGFVSSSKFVKKDLDFYFPIFMNLLESKNQWGVRLALVFFLIYYPTYPKIDEVIKVSLKHNYQEYYIVMAEAWFFSYLYMKNKSVIMPYLEKGLIKGKLLKYFIRKCLDSYRVSEEDKEELRKYQ